MPYHTIPYIEICATPSFTAALGPVEVEADLLELVREVLTTEVVPMGVPPSSAATCEVRHSPPRVMTSPSPCVSPLTCPAQRSFRVPSPIEEDLVGGPVPRLVRPRAAYVGQYGLQNVRSLSNSQPLPPSCASRRHTGARSGSVTQSL
jgi:hypothetical protein